VKRTFTFKLSIMLGTQEKDVRAKAALAGQPRCTFTDERRDLARYPDLG